MANNIPAEFLANLLEVAPDISLERAVLLYRSSAKAPIPTPPPVKATPAPVEEPEVKAVPVGFASNARTMEQLIRYGSHK